MNNIKVILIVQKFWGIKGELYGFGWHQKSESGLWEECHRLWRILTSM